MLIWHKKGDRLGKEKLRGTHLGGGTEKEGTRQTVTNAKHAWFAVETVIVTVTLIVTVTRHGRNRKREGQIVSS